MLLYQLYFDGIIDNPYENDPTFQILKENDVCFVERAKHNTTEENKLALDEFDSLFKSIGNKP